MAKAKTKISFCTKRNNLILDYAQRGFSLLEILVVIALLSLVMMIGLSMTAPERDVALEATDLMERAVRFGSNEAALRNTVIRLHFYLDTDPQKFTVEYGPDDSFIIPLSDLNQENKDDMSESEQADLKARLGDINKDFNRIPEFSNKDQSIPSDVKIIGMGSTLHEKMLYDFEASIYIYPTGEKDESIIFFATVFELVTITIPAFTQDFKIDRYPFETVLEDDEEIFDKGISKANDLFETWKRLK